MDTSNNLEFRKDGGFHWELPDDMALYEELAEYVGLPVEMVFCRCQTASLELAFQWHQNEGGVIDYYRDTDLYIYDLTAYQSRLKVAGAHEWFREKIRERGWATVLDFGGGIGEWAIIAAEEGCKVECVDVANSQTLKYAAWRVERRDCRPSIMMRADTDIMWWLPDYDAIVVMDVFEHLEKPWAFIQAFAKRAEWLIANPNEVQYNWLFPQHISKYTLEPYWEHVEGYLWRRKQ